MTLRDVLQPNKPVRGLDLKDINAFNHGGRNDDNAFESTPARNSRIIQAQKYISPARSSQNVVLSQPGIINNGGSIYGSTCMNNSYLSSRSETFDDDNFERIEKRCFFLICGRNPNDCAISISIGINAFDDPRIKKNL